MNLDHDYFEANLALLKKHHPDAWQTVTVYQEEPIGEFCFAEDGKVNLFVHAENGEEIFFHDTTAPEAEVEVYYKLVPEDATGSVILLGMGLGYSPLAMVRSRRHIRHLAILEPEIGIFVQALHALDLAPFLTDRRVVVALGPEIDVSAITLSMGKALLLESVYILNHLPSSRYNLAAYQTLYDETYKKTNSSNVGGATTRAFGGKFIENRLQHLSAIHHQDLFEHLIDTFVGVPAFIVAGGPSLNKNIHLLPKAKGKAVIIAVDTVLPALLAHGVVPDFTTAIDMEDIVLEKIVDVSDAATQTSLVCASWVSPMLTKRFPAQQVYWTFAAKAMEAWLNDLLGGKMLTCGAGTVAHLSFTAAIMLGCSPIVFVGQDLAFTNMQDHARHTSLTSKDQLARASAANELQWVDGYGGQAVQTSRAWLSDKHHFEWAISAHSDRKFINATEGGVRLEGTEELPLDGVLSTYCQQDIAQLPIAGDLGGDKLLAGRRRMIDGFGRQLKSIAEVEKDMERLDSVAIKIAKEINRLSGLPGEYSRFDSLPKSLKQQVEEIDVLNNRLDKAGVWRHLDEITLNGLQGSERLMHEILELEGEPGQYLKYVGKSIERFVFISQCRRQVLLPFKKKLKHLLEYLQKENLLLQRLTKSKSADNSKKIIFALLELYYGNEDYVLMEKLIATHFSDPHGSADLCFYLGAIAANQSQFEKAEQYFSQAMNLDASFAARIAACRHRLGDQYLDFYRNWQHADRSVALRMCFKGIHHCPDHAALRQILSSEAAQLQAEAEAAATQGTLVEQIDRLVAWCLELSTNANLGLAIGNEAAASLCRLYGNALVSAQEYAKAIEAFAVAIRYAPQAPDLSLLQADAYFASEDFVNGVACLDRAVSLDITYATYWENMGDNLLVSGKPSDALAAFEKCFVALPGEIGLLKKMGDCYLALDLAEAAMEAYQQFKAKMQQLATENQQGIVDNAV